MERSAKIEQRVAVLIANGMPEANARTLAESETPYAFEDLPTTDPETGLPMGKTMPPVYPVKTWRNVVVGGQFVAQTTNGKVRKVCLHVLESGQHPKKGPWTRVIARNWKDGDGEPTAA